MEHVGNLLNGLGNGGVFAALAVALVVTYRSSGVINFATGAIALYSAYTYAWLRDGELLLIVPGLPDSIDLGGPLGFAPAALLALAINAVLGALLYVAVFRPLRNAPPLARAVASLGVLVVIQELMAIRVGTAPVSVRSIFPSERWELGSITLLSDRVYLALSVVAMTAALWCGFRFTRFGLITRASADNETGAYVSGISADRVALVNWMISAVVAGAAGILIAPISPLTPITYTLFVVPALAAALVGGFRNLVATAAAGLVIGMLQSEALSVAPKYDWMPPSGVAELVPLAVILVALLVVDRAIPVRGGLVHHPLGRAPRPRHLGVPTAVGVTLGAVALVATDGTWRSAVIASFIFGVIGLSLVVITGYAGQVSLAQLALAGVGAFTLSNLTETWGVPFPIAPLLAATVATLVGVVIGLPALRIRGLTLGVVTLAFAYAIEALWFRNTDIVASTGAEVSDASLLGIDLAIGTGDDFPRIEFGLLCLFVLVVVAISVAKLRTSSLGSAMLAVRANEVSAAGLGVNVVRVKVLSFAIASFIAGLGGSLLGYRSGVVTYEQFFTLGGLTLLSTGYLAGITSVSGGVLAGVLASSGIVFTAFDRWVDLGRWFGVISGVGVIVMVILNPEGIARLGHLAAARLRRRTASTSVVDDADGQFAAPDAVDAFRPTDGAAHGDGADPAGGLVVEGLTVRYGGVIAVSGVDLAVPRGSIVGLIGPNGAGKTSVIDAVMGFVPASGRVTVEGSGLDGLPPHRRVRQGLSRTFQSLELYDDLTVEENVEVAALAAGVGSESVDGPPGALDRLGIRSLSDRIAGELSQGQRQLVSIARAVAARPAVLLMDEPAAGLDAHESRWLGERIRSLADSGIGVLLVDHDIELVLDLCDVVHVLDFGSTIAEGDADAIRSNPLVVEAYLGDLMSSTGVPTDRGRP